MLAFEDFFKEDGLINEEVLKNFLTVLVSTEAPAGGGGVDGSPMPAGDVV